MSELPSSTERLQLHAFGPVLEADISVRPLTIFIGPQATGKSLTAQLLYFMRGLEELVPPDFDLTDYDPLSDLLGRWMGRSPPDVAFSPQFRARWTAASSKHGQNREFELSAEVQKDELDLALIGNAAFDERVMAATEGSAIHDLIDEYQVYVPAGRLLCSLVPPGLGVSLLTRSRLHWPGYLGLFYEKLEEAIGKLPRGPEHSRQRRLFTEPAHEQITAKSQSSLRGTLSRGHKDVQLTIEDRHRPGSLFTTGIGGSFASGQLEAWPLWTLVQAHLDTESTKRIFIEEPEAHLHPSAQRDTVEALVYLLRQRFRFVLTTHSPYVIYTLNNALMAGMVCEKGKPLPRGISSDFALTSDQISAYRFSSDGIVRSILDEQTGLLDTTELDDPAGQLGADFSALQSALDEVGEDRRGE